MLNDIQEVIQQIEVTPTPQETTSPEISEPQPKPIPKPLHSFTELNVKFLKEGEDIILTWDNNFSDSYKIYRAWSYPQSDSSYHYVGETQSTEFIIKGGYWSGIHYYKVSQIKNNKERFIDSFITYHR